MPTTGSQKHWTFFKSPLLAGRAARPAGSVFPRPRVFTGPRRALTTRDGTEVPVAPPKAAPGALERNALRHADQSAWLADHLRGTAPAAPRKIARPCNEGRGKVESAAGWTLLVRGSHCRVRLSSGGGLQWARSDCRQGVQDDNASAEDARNSDRSEQLPVTPNPSGRRFSAASSLAGAPGSRGDRDASRCSRGKSSLCFPHHTNHEFRRFSRRRNGEFPKNPRCI